jgi:RimJ/RimL family protein N-acetyltransferase
LPPGPPITAQIFATALQRREAMERENGYAVWAVVLRETGQLVGQCGLQPVEGRGPEIELAYHFNKACWNKGYATEAAAAVLSYAFETLRLESVIAIVMPQNVASCRVAEKAGMRFACIATYYGIPDVRKYLAERSWWQIVVQPRTNTAS